MSDSNFSKSALFSKRINDLIPGGCHTYSKGDDQFPINAPAAITHGLGARVWDLNGREYIDCSMGLTSVSIGHGYQPVAKKVSDAAYMGTNFQRPATIELEAAEVFLNTVQSGDMVKFAKNGSTVTTAAVKLARAYTGKNKVAIAREHNFFSFDDWFISTTPCDAGIPKSIKSFTEFFSYNNYESVKSLLERESHDIACLIMEPVKFEPPKDNFLKNVSNLCKDRGVLLILDEMVSGFKWALNGAHNYFDVKADLYTWGKGVANGFSACALTGRSEIMELGGIRTEGADKLFLISTTHGAETIGLAAMIATIQEFKNHNMIEDNWRRGAELKSKLELIIDRYGLNLYLNLCGYPCLFMLICRNHKEIIDDSFRTLMMQELIANGILFQGIFYTTWSHQASEISSIVQAFDSACQVYKQALENGSTDNLLVGRQVKPVFRKYI